MKKLSKLLLTGAIALGLVACNNEEVPNTTLEEGNTHVSVSLTLSTSAPSGFRSGDYNSVGEWAGQDKIESIAIYVVDGTTVSTGQFETADFTVTPNPGDGTNQITITPKKAIRTTPGEKSVYVLINAPQVAITQLATASATDFETAYTNTALNLANTGNTSTGVSTSADKLAKFNVEGEDLILMTNDPATVGNGKVTVADGVTAEQALASTNPQNRAKVVVKRAAARVFVTTQAATFPVVTAAGTNLGTISDITWVLAQGENSLFIQQKPGLPTTIPVTPNSGYVSTDANYYGTTTLAAEHYDYSGLWEDNTTKGTTVPTLAAYVALNDDKDNQTAILESLGLTAQAVRGKFILPNTHTYGAGDASSYKKGNTAYVLIRTIFTPTTFADGTTDYVKGTDFYLGANGKFYASAANAQDPTKGGVAEQTVAKYIGGKVLYYAWVNPDAIPAWFNSPVLRNNIYHIHISGVRNIGTNWNPLVPGDDPTTVADDANNPDPKPTIPDPANPTGPQIPDPNEPVNPIKPEDPLTLPETWMSVDITVQPWKVHSYQLNLGM